LNGPESIVRECTRCHQSFPATTEYFHRKKGGRLGLDSICKSCSKNRTLKYAAEHRERTNAGKRAWREANPERQRDYVKAWKSAHPDSSKKYESTRSPGWASDYRRRKLAENPEWERNQRRRNPDAFRARDKRKRARRSARLRNLPATMTPADWRFALEYFGGCCAVCGRPPGLWHTISPDHWIPLSKQGPTTPDNIVPLCHGRKGGAGCCNNSKRDVLPESWLTAKFGAAKAKTVLARISTYFAAVSALASEE